MISKASSGHTGNQLFTRLPKQVKVLNFGSLLMCGGDDEKLRKKQYYHAEYLSPEQIEKSEEITIMQCGEVWNLGVMLYVLY